MDKQHTNQQGFTLIEILIAVTVFAIGILAVASMQISSIKGNSSASGLTEAATLAEEKMEELMAIGYDDARLIDTDGDGTNQDADNDGIDDGGDDFGLDDYPQNPKGAPYLDQDFFTPSQIGPSQYNIYWNIAEDEPITNNKTIRVIVTWQGEGRARRVTLNSVKSPI